MFNLITALNLVTAVSVACLVASLGFSVNSQSFTTSTLLSSSLSIWGVMRGVDTQKLNDNNKGKTVMTGSNSNIVTISFFPKLACLIPDVSLYTGCFWSFMLTTVTLNTLLEPVVTSYLGIPVRHVSLLVC